MPSQVNFLDGSRFSMSIARLPTTTFMAQKIQMPSVYLPVVDTPNPFVKLNHASTHLEYAHLYVEFKIDEDLRNYQEIYNWMIGLGFPEDHGQYKELVKGDKYQEIRSDLSIVIYTSSNIPNKVITFRDTFPSTLSEWVLTSTEDGQPNYMTVRVGFSVRDMKFENIKP